MPALQVRDFPEDLYGRLKVYAEKNHRSVAQQTIVAVEQMLDQDAFASKDPSVSSEESAFQPRVIARPSRTVRESIELDRDPVERQKRAEKRRTLFREIEEQRALSTSPFFHDPSVPDPVTVIREMRAERDRQMCETLGLPYEEEDEA